ncbi:MAG: zinc ribbon domain-containing protein [Dehalococcoidia bacterium]|jgi:putative FmdB family regulatory protein
MPIYEYRATGKGCGYCARGFDTLQKMSDSPLTHCPKCGVAIRRVVSRFSACTVETADSDPLENKLQDYESQGMWSHAAELADKSGLQERAMDDYKKAGYNF